MPGYPNPRMPTLRESPTVVASLTTPISCLETFKLPISTLSCPRLPMASPSPYWSPIQACVMGSKEDDGWYVAFPNRQDRRGTRVPLSVTHSQWSPSTQVSLLPVSTSNSKSWSPKVMVASNVVPYWAAVRGIMSEGLHTSAEVSVESKRESPSVGIAMGSTVELESKRECLEL